MTEAAFKKLVDQKGEIEDELNAYKAAIPLAEAGTQYV